MNLEAIKEALANYNSHAHDPFEVNVMASYAQKTIPALVAEVERLQAQQSATADLVAAAQAILNQMDKGDPPEGGWVDGPWVEAALSQKMVEALRAALARVSG